MSSRQRVPESQTVARCSATYQIGLRKDFEITEQYARNHHFVGDWHSHRQRKPHPSDTDLLSMQELVRESTHGLAGFFLVIVGLGSVPDCLHVSLHTKSASHELTTDD